MEDLFNSYKKIVDRAVAIGLVSEENKSCYLSAIQDETPVSENILANTSAKVRTCKTHQSLDAFFSPRRQFEPKHQGSSNQREVEKLNVFNSEWSDTQSIAKTIENPSILNLSNMRDIKTYTVESDSDLMSNVNEDSIFHPVERATVTLSRTEEARKKPKKNEIINFNIPIYMDLRQKNLKIKSPVLISKSHLRKAMKEARPRIKTCTSNEYEEVRKLKSKSSKHGKWVFKPSSLMKNSSTSNTGEIIQNLDGKKGVSHKIFSPIQYSEIATLSEIKDNKFHIQSDELRDCHQCRDTHLKENEFIKNVSNISRDKGKLTRNLDILQHVQSKPRCTKQEEQSPLEEQENKHCSESLNNESINLGKDIAFNKLTSTKFPIVNEEDKLLNINIICQFFPDKNSTSEPQQSGDNFSFQKELSKGTISDQQSKEKNQKKVAHHLSKIFSRTKLK